MKGFIMIGLLYTVLFFFIPVSIFASQPVTYEDQAACASASAQNPRSVRVHDLVRTTQTIQLETDVLFDSMQNFSSILEYIKPMLTPYCDAPTIRLLSEYEKSPCESLFTVIFDRIQDIDSFSGFFTNQKNMICALNRGLRSISQKVSEYQKTPSDKSFAAVYSAVYNLKNQVAVMALDDREWIEIVSPSIPFGLALEDEICESLNSHITAMQKLLSPHTTSLFKAIDQKIVGTLKKPDVQDCIKITPNKIEMHPSAGIRWHIPQNIFLEFAYQEVQFSQKAFQLTFLSHHASRKVNTGATDGGEAYLNNEDMGVSLWICSADTEKITHLRAAIRQAKATIKRLREQEHRQELTRQKAEKELLQMFGEQDSSQKRKTSKPVVSSVAAGAASSEASMVALKTEPVTAVHITPSTISASQNHQLAQMPAKSSLPVVSSVEVAGPATSERLVGKAGPATTVRTIPTTTATSQSHQLDQASSRPSTQVPSEPSLLGKIRDNSALRNFLEMCFRHPHKAKEYKWREAEKMLSHLAKAMGGRIEDKSAIKLFDAQGKFVLNLHKAHGGDGQMYTAQASIIARFLEAQDWSRNLFTE